MTIKELYDLVHQFNAHEQSLIRFAIKGSKEEDENKSLQLFEFVIGQNKDVSRRTASLAIYKASPDTRINKLISRLWERILDIIISENFLRKSGRLSEQAKSRLSARKKMLQSATLMFLNGTSTTNTLLTDKSIEDAKKTESHMMLVDLYRINKSDALFRGNLKEYLFFSKQVLYHQKCHALEQKILHYYNEHTEITANGNSKSPEKILKYLNRIVTDLRKEKKYMDSVISQSLFTMLEVECLYLKENYIGAKKLVIRHFKKIGQSFMAGGRANVAGKVEEELGTCELLLGNYKQAVMHRERCSLHWHKDKMNYFISLEGLIRAYFFNKEYDQAEKIVAELLSNQNPITGELRNTKPNYFQACIHFKKHECAQALKIVSKAMPLNKDKTGYDIAIRILRIQCLLELQRFDEASTHIENLRKHVSRNSKKTYTSERNISITRTLVLMQKRGFSGQPNKTESGWMKNLTALTGKYKWSPMTTELIRFHEWYEEFNGILRLKSFDL